MEAWIQQAIAGMEKNGFVVAQVKTKEEARDYLLSQIDGAKSVGAGGSVSVRETEVLPALEKKGCAIHTHWGTKGEEAEAIMLKARAADIYLCSVNAITKTGKLVMIDGRGNRVGAICDGPKEVYLIVSKNKIVDGGLEAAIARIKKEAVPPNCRRLRLNTPCAQTGKCGGNACADPSCRLTVVVDAVPRLRKITVVLVDEKLGY